MFIYTRGRGLGSSMSLAQVLPAVGEILCWLHRWTPETGTGEVLPSTLLPADQRCLGFDLMEPEVWGSQAALALWWPVLRVL